MLITVIQKQPHPVVMGYGSQSHSGAAASVSVVLAVYKREVEGIQLSRAI